jgi:RNA polymerase sigma factor (sigma-70 family)
MVFGVCHRLLGNDQDAEDALQATFLVLARKAGSVVPRALLANWLYGVAHQTAIRVRAQSAKRRGREKQVAVMPEPEALTQDVNDDLQRLLHQELQRLPEKYRVAVVLCDLEGRTRKEVAQQLGWAEGSVSSRLARGRALLARRLAKRGLALAGATLTVMLTQAAAPACLPASLVSTTVKAAGIMAAGQSAVTGLISAKVAAVTEGVLMTMLLNKIKSVLALCFIVCLMGLGFGVSILAGQTPATQTEQPERKTGEAPAAPPAAVKKSDEKESTLVALKQRIAALEQDIDLLRARMLLLADRVESLQNKIEPRTAPAAKPEGKRPDDRREVRMFTLRYLKADDAAKTLQQLSLQTDSEKPMRIAASQSTNTVIVQGGLTDLDVVAEFLERLEKLGRQQKVEEEKNQPKKN